ncbi:MAG: S46 family peptidase, partial [Rhodothermales bacterium]|nr:S46 family peptidase [Rhodothermales bacterium]
MTLRLSLPPALLLALSALLLAAPPAPAQEAPTALEPALLDTVRAGRFDNGRMWTFENPPLDYLAETYGFRPDDAWFERARLGALRIPGCTASFVSPHGLVMTNHHCARSIAARLSREGEDLLNEGFFARALDEERPVDEFYADQLVAIADVTDEVAAALDAAQTDAERQQALQEVTTSIEERIKAEAGGGDDTVVQVVGLYSGGRYSAYTFRRYADLRLVFAPELALGNFGGEWDNFSYPRYKLDAAFFRAYGPDGEPLDTSEFYFPWSEEGTEPGELVFVVGNPGSTNRLETVAQLAFRRDVTDSAVLGFLARRLEALRAEYEADPSPDLKATILSISNAEKLYRGRVAGLRDPAILARRADTERQFREAVAADPGLRAAYGDLIDRIAAVQQEKRAYADDFGAFVGLQPQQALASATMRRALLAHDLLQQRDAQVPEEQLQALEQQILSIGDLPPAREERFLTIRLRELLTYLGDDPEVQEVLAGRSPEAAAEALLQRTAFADSAGTA